MLSPAGLKWLNDLDSTILESVCPNTDLTERVSENQETERRRLRTTRAYELFVGSKPDMISRQDFFQFARVNDYFQTKARQRRYTIIEGAVASDASLSKIWGILKQRFPEEM